MPPRRPVPPRRIPALVAAAAGVLGLGAFVTFVVVNATSGQAGDPTLTSAALALTGLGAAVGADWWRRQNVR